MRRSVLILAVLMTITCVMSGCPPVGTHDPGFVAKEWSATLREFGIVPVYPPREDVAVGDLYLSPTPPDDKLEMRVLQHTPGQFLPIPVLVASIDVRQDLQKYYANRSSFPATPGAPSTQPAAIAQPHGSADIFVTGDDTRLRLGGFPEFFSTQISRGGIDGLIPTEAVNVAFGAFASANKQVRVSVPMVESYGLPVSTLTSKLTFSADHKTLTFSGTGSGPVALKGADLAKLFDGQKYASQNKDIVGYLRLITEVYATRAIDVSVDAQLGRSGGLNAKPTAAMLGKLPGVAAIKPAASQPAPAAAAPAPAATRPAAQPADFNTPTPQQIAASMTNELNDALAASVPGVSVKFLSVTAFGVSMRRTYERPVVIGYRAVLISVDKNGVMEIAGVSSSPIPTDLHVEADRKAAEREIAREVSAQLKLPVSVKIFVQTTPYKVIGKVTGEIADADAVKTHATELLRQAVQARPDMPPDTGVEAIVRPDAPAPTTAPAAAPGDSESK